MSLKREGDRNMEKLKISVIIPVYNTAEYLPRCLDSVLQNTYQNLEVICVNDGSTDDSAAVLERYAETDSRVIVVNKVNEGVSVARNTGLDMATGDFIAFIDSDDWVHGQYFEILMYYQNQFRANMVICRPKTIACEETSTKITVGKSESRLLDFDRIIADSNAKRRVWGRVYSKVVIQNHRFEAAIKLSEDTVFNLEVICSCNKLKCVMVEEQLYYYYTRATSAVHTLPNDAIYHAAEWYIIQTGIATDLLIKETFLFEAFKAVFSYRYAEMFNSDRKKVRQNSRKILNQCMNYLGEIDCITAKKKLQYTILAKAPFIYRAFRILDDPSLLDWEKAQKQRRKKKNL